LNSRIDQSDNDSSKSDVDDVGCFELVLSSKLLSRPPILFLLVVVTEELPPARAEWRLALVTPVKFLKKIIFLLEIFYFVVLLHKLLEYLLSKDH
jgi:hypothetical protein